MYPGPIFIFGSPWATWNIAFLVGTLAGYFILRSTYSDPAAPPVPRYLPLRYALCVYVCALGAQWFAYAFDSNTTVLPPPDVNPWRYYLHPLAGPKTLYGAILLLPLAALAFVPGTSVSWRSALERSTPALFGILTFARIGCFLQGCCYGLRNETFGLSFPLGSMVQGEQATARLIGFEDPSLPVLPTQIASALACFALAIWSRSRLRRGETNVFFASLAAYSAFRFAVEFVRADDARNHFWMLSTSQWIAVAILLAMAALSQIGATAWTREPPQQG
jgi:phosphatidylglycerol---prolipoprotein diacylglyceryl transferase